MWEALFGVLEKMRIQVIDVGGAVRDIAEQNVQLRWQGLRVDAEFPKTYERRVKQSGCEWQANWSSVAPAKNYKTLENQSINRSIQP